MTQAVDSQIDTGIARFQREGGKFPWMVYLDEGKYQMDADQACALGARLIDLGCALRRRVDPALPTLFDTPDLGQLIELHRAVRCA